MSALIEEFPDSPRLSCDRDGFVAATVHLDDRRHTFGSIAKMAASISTMSSKIRARSPSSVVNIGPSSQVTSSWLFNISSASATYAPTLVPTPHARQGTSLKQ